MEFDVSVFVITSDMKIVFIEDYVNYGDGDGVFVMLTNDELNSDFGEDNSICIYGDWYNALKRTKNSLSDKIKYRDYDNGYKDYCAACAWQKETKEIPVSVKVKQDIDQYDRYDTRGREWVMRKYFDGYKTNQEIMRNVIPLLGECSIEEYLPAIMTAYHTEVSFGDVRCHGYLPAMGQWIYISKNINTVNSALRVIDVNSVPFLVHQKNNGLLGWWWSVNEYNDECAWTMSYGYVAEYYKYETNMVLPIFAAHLMVYQNEHK